MTVEARLTINTTTAAVWAATTDIARFERAYDPEENMIELWEPKEWSVVNTFAWVPTPH